MLMKIVFVPSVNLITSNIHSAVHSGTGPSLQHGVGEQCIKLNNPVPFPCRRTANTTISTAASSSLPP
jgi:hypothetical protein